MNGPVEIVSHIFDSEFIGSRQNTHGVTSTQRKLGFWTGSPRRNSFAARRFFYWLTGEDCLPVFCLLKHFAPYVPRRLIFSISEAAATLHQLEGVRERSLRSPR